MKYRIKYWQIVNEYHGEWQRTGLMTKKQAELLAENLRGRHEMVEVYKDEEE